MGVDKAIWSVGGGKGGIGKSVATANIGCALAKAGREVILVDADLGGANLHTYFGVQYPQTGLDDFLKGRIKDLGSTAVPTELPNLKLICGAGEFLGIANPAHSQKLKLMKGIKDLSAEFIIVDRGAAQSAAREIRGFRPRLLLNMAASKEDVKAVEAFKNAAETFLGMDA